MLLNRSITDAQNECRDKVKYLESLRRPIDQFYHEASPITCITTALPGLCTSMRAVESVSRYYARQGYLGLLFTKVSNQLVNVCTEYLFEMGDTIENEPVFYSRIFKELDSINFDAESEEILNYSTSRASAIIKYKPVESDINNTTDTFYQRLKNCLMVQIKYKEAFRNLRDALGGSQALQSFPQINASVSSMQTTDASSALRKRRSTVFASATPSLQNDKPHGILMSEEQVIFENIDKFCDRINVVIDQIKSLKQFHDLLKASKDLKRPKKEEVGVDDEEETSMAKNQLHSQHGNGKQKQPEVLEEEEEVVVDQSRETTTNELFSASKAILETLVEENEESSPPPVDLKKNYFIQRTETSSDSLKKVKEEETEGNVTMQSVYEMHNQKLDRQVGNSNRKLLESAEKLFGTEKRTEADTKYLLKKAQHISSDDVKLMKKYYGKSEGPAISSIIESYLIHMKKLVKSVNAAQVLDVDEDAKKSNAFDVANKNFMIAQNSLEKFLGAYINVIFTKTKKTHDGLAILAKFKSVENRNHIKNMYVEKDLMINNLIFMEIISNYFCLKK